MHLVLLVLNLSTLDAGILIMLQQVWSMMFSLNIVDYSLSFLLLSTWNFLGGQVGWTILKLSSSLERYWWGVLPTGIWCHLQSPWDLGCLGTKGLGQGLCLCIFLDRPYLWGFIFRPVLTKDGRWGESFASWLASSWQCLVGIFGNPYWCINCSGRSEWLYLVEMNKKYDKFHVHQCQAQNNFKIWPSSNLAVVWPFTRPSSDLPLTLYTQPPPNLN